MSRNAFNQLAADLEEEKEMRDHAKMERDLDRMCRRIRSVRTFKPVMAFPYITQEKYNGRATE